MKTFQQLIDESEGADEADRILDFSARWNLGKGTAESYLRRRRKLSDKLLGLFNAHHSYTALKRYIDRIEAGLE